MENFLLKKGKWLLVVALAGMMVSCSNDDDDDVIPDSGIPTEKKGYQVGDLLYHRFGYGDTIIEEVVDSVVNFGTDTEPAIFGVCLKHQVDGKAVKPGIGDLKCVFQSLNFEELQDFADLYAEAIGEKKPGVVLTKEQKVKIFVKLHKFVESTGQPALLYYLLKNDVSRYPELQNLSNAMQNSRASRGEGQTQTNEDPLMEMAQQLLPESERALPRQSVKAEEQPEIPDMKPRKPTRWDIFNAALYYKYYDFPFIKEGKPCKYAYVENFPPLYCFWIGDCYVFDKYTEQNLWYSNTFFIYHGTSLTPLSGIRFHFTMDSRKYTGDFSTFYEAPESGQYVSGYFNTGIWCTLDDYWRWLGQYCDGWYAWEGGYLDMKAAESGVLQTQHTFYIDFHYGDSTLCEYKAHCKFLVLGDSFTTLYEDIEHVH